MVRVHANAYSIRNGLSGKIVAWCRRFNSYRKSLSVKPDLPTNEGVVGALPGRTSRAQSDVLEVIGTSTRNQAAMPGRAPLGEHQPYEKIVRLPEESMKQVCAWCFQSLGEDIEPLDDLRTTHGICPPCNEKWIADWKAKHKARQDALVETEKPCPTK